MTIKTVPPEPPHFEMPCHMTCGRTGKQTCVRSQRLRSRSRAVNTLLTTLQPCLGQEGEALSLSYIDSEVPRAARRDALRSNFFFACDCQRCEPCRCCCPGSFLVLLAEQAAHEALHVRHLEAAELMQTFTYHVSRAPGLFFEMRKLGVLLSLHRAASCRHAHSLHYNRLSASRRAQVRAGAHGRVGQMLLRAQPGRQESRLRAQAPRAQGACRAAVAAWLG